MPKPNKKKIKPAKSLLFVLRFLKHPKRVGTFFQTPGYVADKIVNEIIGKDIIEFGPGLGAITYKILEKLTHDGKLTCFETDRLFYNHLEKNRKRLNDLRFEVLNKSAEHLEDYVQNFDCIVSGIPLTFVNRAEIGRILKISKKARRYIQYKYVSSEKLLDDYFTSVRKERVGIHVIYVCSNEH